jgi:ParB-like chromosome segregation protein Spo0J
MSDKDKDKEKARVAFADIVIVEGSNSRKTYTNIDELAASMDENGMISDLVVRESGGDKEGKRKYPLIAGHRRYKAIELLRDPEWSPKDKSGKKLPRKTTPASWAQVNVKKVKGNTQQQAQLNLVENLQRENLDPLEEAQAMFNYIETYKVTQAELAHKLGKSEPYISQRLSLLKNTATEVKEALETGDVSPTQVREMVTMPKPVQKEVLQKIKDKQAETGKKMSVEDVKVIADKEKAKLGIKREKTKKKGNEPEYDNEKVAAAKEIYEGKEIDMRPKTAILEQLGALNGRLKKDNISDETKAKTKNYIAALEFTAGLRDSL